MRRIRSHLNIRSADYKTNRECNLARVDAFRDLQQAVRFERPEKDIQRLERQKKLFVRDRLELLLDPDSPFLELSSLAANKAYGGEIFGGGQVAGIGIVNGREVLVHASDSVGM